MSDSEYAAPPCWPSGRFRCIVADPPWHVKAGPRSLHDENERSRPLVYPTMTLAEIEAMPVAGVADKDAHLYLWTINRYVENAYTVARAWGFEPSTLLVWAKRPKGRGLGGTWPTFTEFCLFARRGTLKATTRGPSNWWTWTRGKHSEKPEAFQDMVETVSPGPYLELFARRPRLGWTVWGNEVEANTEPHRTPDRPRAGGTCEGDGSASESGGHHE